MKKATGFPRSFLFPGGILLAWSRDGQATSCPPGFFFISEKGACDGKDRIDGATA
nr:MAG TPA: hypothetical protein [Caudoviricetes sp.]